MKLKCVKRIRYSIVAVIPFCFLLLSCDEARDKHNKGLPLHPHSDPYGPKDSTMVEEDSVSQPQTGNQEE